MCRNPGEGKDWKGKFMKVFGVCKRKGRTYVVGSGTYEEVKALNTKEDYDRLITAYRKEQRELKKHGKKKSKT